MKPRERPVIAPHPTDVAQFFIDITESYLCFERSILHFIHILPICSPNKILHECQKLALQREQLAHLDEQLDAILALAGAEIAKTHMVHDYRIAFAKALMASNTLHQKLLAVKASLQPPAIIPALS